MKLKLNKDRFNKKRMICFGKTFGISLSIVLVLLCGSWFLSEYLKYRSTTEVTFPLGMQIGDYDEYMETQKDVASDISGMSVYDKYIMGLELQEGSDSDYDGLTDKEEIEIYGSDPLAASTAGDLYSDGYKVEHGLDLFTYLDYEEEMVFPYIECDEVTITPATPTDFYTVVKDYTDMYSLEEYNIKEIYKGYCLYNYGGNVTVDVSDILVANDISLKDMQIYIVEGLYVMQGATELIQCRYEEQDNKLTLQYSFDDDAQYLIYITSKKQLTVSAMLEDVADSFFFGNSLDSEESEKITGKGIVYGSPLLEQLFGIHLKAYYAESDNKENTNIVYNLFVKYCDSYKGMSISNANIYSDSEVKIEAKQKIFDSFLSYFELPMDNDDTSRIRNAFFVYTKYENAYSKNGVVIEETTTNNNGFDKYVDELPFQNFESYIAPYGNCAGISHLTAYLYNTKSIPSSGSYECEIDGDNQVVTWDIGKNTDNATLLNPGLSDYKNEDFIDELSATDNNYIQNSLSEGEKEFVNMIGCFWAEGNSKIDSSYLKASGTMEDYSILEGIMDYVDSGKIVDVYMYMRYGGGHAVNIYGYKHTAYEDQTIFYIYDSNIPQDDRNGYTVDRTNGTCMLQTIKVIDKVGNEKFIYAYWPMTSHESYQATNYIGKQEWCMFVPMDENWNILQ